MPSDRDARAVYRARPSDGEVAEVLAQRLVATVGTVNEDGSVHLAYVLFLHADGRLFFETSSVTRKARNAERTGRATLLVQGQAASAWRSWEGSVLRAQLQTELRVPYEDAWLDEK